MMAKVDMFALERSPRLPPFFAESLRRVFESVSESDVIGS